MKWEQVLYPFNKYETKRDCVFYPQVHNQQAEESGFELGLCGSIACALTSLGYSAS